MIFFKNTNYMKFILDFHWLHYALSQIIYRIFMGRNNFYFPNKTNNILISKQKKILIYKVTAHRFGHKFYDYHYSLYLAYKLNYQLCIYLKDEKFNHYLFSVKSKKVNKINLQNNFFLKFKYNIFFYALKNIYNFKKNFLRYKFLNKIYFLEKYNIKFRGRRDRGRYLISNALLFKPEFDFEASHLSKVNKILSKLNIDKPIITLSVRNDLYVSELLKLHGVQKKINKRKSKNDSTRNSNIQIYKKLVKKYQNEFFFVKVGFPDNDKSLRGKNFYDLSRSKHWSEMIETIIIYKSFLCICPDTGLIALLNLLRKSKIIVNGIHPLINNVFPESYTIMKEIRDENKNLIGKDVAFSENNLVEHMNENFTYTDVNENTFLKVTIDIIEHLKNDRFILKHEISDATKHKLRKIKLNIVKKSNYMYKWISTGRGIGPGRLMNINIERFESKN